MRARRRSGAGFPDDRCHGRLRPFRPSGFARLHEIRAENTNNELVLDPEGGRPQVPARPHRLFEDRLPVVDPRIPGLNFLAPTRCDRSSGSQQFPRGLRVVPFLAGVDDRVDRDLMCVKNLLSIFARSSAFSKICPVDFHRDLLCRSRYNAIRNKSKAPVRRTRFP